MFHFPHNIIIYLYQGTDEWIRSLEVITIRAGERSPVLSAMATASLSVAAGRIKGLMRSSSEWRAREAIRGLTGTRMVGSGGLLLLEVRVGSRVNRVRGRGGRELAKAICRCSSRSVPDVFIARVRWSQTIWTSNSFIRKFHFNNVCEM